MKKVLSHLVVLSISLLCPVILIGGNYLMEKNRMYVLPSKETEKSKRLHYSDFYTENDSLFNDIIKTN